jgi:hypothetical protein
MIPYDMIGFKTVTSTPPAPAFPVVIPLKNKIVYNEMESAAPRRSRIPLLFIVKGCLNTARMIIIDKNVKEKRRKVSVIGDP